MRNHVQCLCVKFLNGQKVKQQHKHNLSEAVEDDVSSRIKILYHQLHLDPNCIQQIRTMRKIFNNKTIETTKNIEQTLQRISNFYYAYFSFVRNYFIQFDFNLYHIPYFQPPLRR